MFNPYISYLQDLAGEKLNEYLELEDRRSNIAAEIINIIQEAYNEGRKGIVDTEPVMKLVFKYGNAVEKVTEKQAEIGKYPLVGGYCNCPINLINELMPLKWLRDELLCKINGMLLR